MMATCAAAAADPLLPTPGRLMASQTLNQTHQLAVQFKAPREPFVPLLAQLAGELSLRPPPGLWARAPPRAHPRRIRPAAVGPTSPRPLVFAIAALFGCLPPPPPLLKSVPPLGPPTPLSPTRPLMPISCGPIRSTFSCSPWPAFARAKAVKANQIKQSLIASQHC